MRIIVSGGGTGGHIYPALTIVRTIQKYIPDAEFLYVGTHAGLEADIIPKEGLPFTAVDIQGFERRLTPVNILRAGQAFCGVIKAMDIVRQFKPDVAVGTGGYVCGPILMAAALMKVPALIQEQNVVAGITNKILARFVNKIAIGTKEAAGKFPADKVIYTGNPIRAEVMSAQREQGIREFGLDPQKRTILVSGGSRGARSINKAMIGVHRYYAGNKSVQILHVTGRNGYDEVIREMDAAGIDLETAGNIFVKPYLYNMPFAMAATDLAIFRAGAIGIAELTARGIPSILVPYPYAAENHQEFNAKAVEKNGAARVILDKDVSAERINSIIMELFSDELKLDEMRRASKTLGKPQAAEEIAKMVIALAQGKEKRNA